MLHDVRKYCDEHGLLPRGSKILIGLSGGPDSVALLLVLQSLAESLGISLYAAHLNHGFRGQEAAEDAAFAEALCSYHHVPCTVGQIDVPALIKSTNGSPQAVAREARFRFLRDVLEQYGCDYVALGHHRDDQAETVLLNVVRGTGVEGLAAMLPKDEGLYGLKIIRPLLSQSRATLEKFLATSAQDYRIDSSNLKSDYSRNFIRHNVIPQLQTLNPRVAESIARLAQAAAADEAYFAEQVANLWTTSVASSTGALLVSVGTLAELNTAIAARLIRKVWQQHSSLELSYQHVMAILGLCGKQTGKKIELPGGNVALRLGENIMFMHVAATRSYEEHLDIPGFTNITEVGTLTAEWVWQLSQSSLHGCDPFTAYLSLNIERLKVRTRLPGDRYWPLGAPGAKKLKEVMSEAQIPAPLRDRWPVLCHGDQIVWVPGVRVSELYKVTQRDKVVRLRFIRGGS